MVNKVLKVGDSAAVTIPKQVLKELGLQIGDKVNITFHPNESEIVVKALRPIHGLVSDRVARLTTDFIDHYREALRKLA